MTVAGRCSKEVTRRAVRAARAARDPAVAAAVEVALARQVGLALTVPARGQPSVAVYLSLPGEPGTTALRDELRRRGRRVLVPVLRPDLDLDWVLDPGPGAPADPLRPEGDRLGPGALTACSLVLVPALAVDALGTRLGQGGGSYDRALARLVAGGPGPLVLAVVHDEEVLVEPLPRAPHDVAVDGALTPSGPVLLGPPGPRRRLPRVGRLPLP